MLYPLCLGVTNWLCWRLPVFHALSAGLSQALIPNAVSANCKNPKTGKIYYMAFLPSLIGHLLRGMNSSISQGLYSSGYSVVCPWLTTSSTGQITLWGQVDTTGLSTSQFPHSFVHLHYALVRISYTKKWLDIRAKSPCFFVGNRI